MQLSTTGCFSLCVLNAGRKDSWAFPPPGRLFFPKAGITLLILLETPNMHFSSTKVAHGYAVVW